MSKTKPSSKGIKIPFNHPILRRELNRECLSCGKSLHHEIIGRKIRIHLCESCRIELINTMNKGNELIRKAMESKLREIKQEVQK